MVFLISQISLRKPASSLLKPAVSPPRKKLLSGRALEVRKKLFLVGISSQVARCMSASRFDETHFLSFADYLVNKNLISIVPLSAY